MNAAPVPPETTAEVPDLDELVALVCELADELAPDLAEPVDTAAGAGAPLYGRGGPLPSIALVALVAGLEQELDARYGVWVELADDRAVSQTRSPFATVGSLAAHALARLAEAG